MIRALRRPYAFRSGVPVISRVDDEIFVQRYFVHCLDCTYCHDSCCFLGCDIDAPNVERIRSAAPLLEPHVGSRSEEWFRDEYDVDPEVPGARYTRTRTPDGACVFLNRRGRGCLIHGYCLENALDYHELKPTICTIFPVTWDQGLLRPADEFLSTELACYADGPIVYQGARHELGYYFGPELVAELDLMEAEVPAVDLGPAVPPRRPPARRRLGT